ncbi:MAG TPA: Hsp20/alpha crystallin family protein [Abditibacteriaceae bacterium]|nr:Hsp20/alpha crystallin family protein [Abditibacteriaceae bacterium]
MLMRTSPTEMQELRNRMNQVLEESGRAAHETEPRHWTPAVDVLENERAIVLQAELPGMNKDDIDIELTGETLTLHGERKLEPAQRGEHFHRIERQYGPWQRTFQIEVPIDTAQVAASYEDGVLTVHLPKQEAVKPRQIAIEVK